MKGAQLTEFIQEYNITIANNSIPTHMCHTNHTTSVIDLMLVSEDLADKIEDFRVHSEDMNSDHYPIRDTFQLKTKKQTNPYIKYIKRIDWNVYPEILDAELITTVTTKNCR